MLVALANGKAWGYKGRVLSSPDYSRQLAEIAKALNRPSTPTWIIVLLSTVVGAISSVLVQMLSLRLADRYKRHKMRRILYHELAARGSSQCLSNSPWPTCNLIYA
jgi:hypothetical protein